MEKIIHKNWEFFVEKEETEHIYQNFDFKPCECLYCKNFEEQKDNIFPKECLELFGKLGIDYRKYAEICCPFPENDWWIYSGWYHFKGEFNGINAKVQENNQVFYIEMTPITETFSLGFHYDNSLTFFNPMDKLVQVEFEIKIPWVLDELP